MTIVDTREWWEIDNLPDPSQQRTCTHCKKIGPLEAFALDRSVPPKFKGRSKWCKDCILWNKKRWQARRKNKRAAERLDKDR
jgi:hypothetical protein